MFKQGDRVIVIGDVNDIMAHHNGVVGVTITFGEGIERKVVVPDSIVFPADMLEMASAFDVLPYDRSRRIRSITVARRSIEPDAWAIVGEGETLSRDGEWVYEPLPSSRTDEYFARCRWPTAREAITFVRNHLRQYPDGHKP